MKPISSRSFARLAAIQYVYRKHFLTDHNPTHARNMFATYFVDPYTLLGLEEKKTKLVDLDEGFFQRLVLCFEENYHVVKQVFEENIDTQNRFDRMEFVLQDILCLGITEILYFPDIPFKVIIKEYVQLTDAFFQDKEAVIANAFLDKITHRYRKEPTP